MTPIDLIRQSLLTAHISLTETIYAEDIYRAYDLLNMMLAQWNRNRWLIWHLRDVWCVANGNATYLFGPGYDFPAPRTDKLEAAFARYITATGAVPLGDPLGGDIIGESQTGRESSGVDYPLTVLPSRQDYNRAMVKGITPTPYYVFYDAEFPVAKVHFYPVPQAGMYELHLTVKEELRRFTGLTTDILLPDEYLEAISFNLGVRLRVSYQMPPDAQLSALAAGALNTIRGANTMIPNLMMPGSIPSGRPRFNIYSGR